MHIRTMTGSSTSLVHHYICMPHIQTMAISSTPHVMSTSCSPHVMHTTYHAHIMHTSCSSHVMRTSCSPHVMHTLCSPHVMHTSSTPQDAPRVSSASAFLDLLSNNDTLIVLGGPQQQNACRLQEFALGSCVFPKLTPALATHASHAFVHSLSCTASIPK